MADNPFEAPAQAELGHFETDRTPASAYLKAVFAFFFFTLGLAFVVPVPLYILLSVLHHLGVPAWASALVKLLAGLSVPGLGVVGAVQSFRLAKERAAAERKVMAPSHLPPAPEASGDQSVARSGGHRA